MKYTELPCMKDMLDTYSTGPGTRHKMARQLAIACKKDNIEYNYALNVFGRRFYVCCRGRDFDFSEVAKCFSSAYKQKQGFIHCPSIIKAEHCKDDFKAECELYNRKKTEACTKKKGGRPKKEIDTERLIQLKKEGKSTRDIGEELDISHTSVRRELNKLKEQQEPSK